MTLWIVLGFLAVIAGLVALDVGVLTRKPRAVSATEAWLSVQTWAVTTLLMSLVLFAAYKYDAIPPEVFVRVERNADAAWLQFLTAYVVELGLSLDNIAVLALILAHFNVDPAKRARALMWVFVSCLALRALLIYGAASVLTYAWTHWIFVFMVGLSVVRTATMPDKDSKLERKWLVRLARWWTGEPPAGAKPSDDGPVDRLRGWTRRSPIVVIVLTAAAADLTFALDSIPAVFSVTRDPLIAFISNALAILSLRSLYFALAGVIGRLRYLRLGVVLVLVGLMVKLIIFKDTPVPTLWTLGGVIGTLGLAIAASIPHARREALARPTPIEDLADAVDSARRNVRKLAVLIAGSLVLLTAILIGPLPGPGFLILAPIGVGILATEFVWAKSLMGRLQAVQDRTDAYVKGMSVWWVPPVVVGFWGGIALIAWGLNAQWGVRWGLTFTLLGGGFVPVGFWAYRTIVMDYKRRKAARGPAAR
jgi:tellurite resistance protein TerC